MSRWTFGFASLLFLTFSLPAVAQSDDLPHSIELKPGVQPAEGTPAAKTRQIVTESKDGAAAPTTPAAAPPADADATPTAKTPAEAAPVKAEAKPAEAEQGPPPGPAPAAAEPGAIVLAVQTELKRVGCDPGEVDGVWGGHSRDALAAFGHSAKVDVADLRPTAEILAILKGKGAPVCQIAAAPPRDDEAEPPVAAPHRHHGYGGYGGGGY
jgi:hypothetical protein